MIQWECCDDDDDDMMIWILMMFFGTDFICVCVRVCVPTLDTHTYYSILERLLLIECKPESERGENRVMFSPPVS